MQHVLNVKTKSDPYANNPELIEARYCEPPRIRQVAMQCRGVSAVQCSAVQGGEKALARGLTV